VHGVVAWEAQALYTPRRDLSQLFVLLSPLQTDRIRILDANLKSLEAELKEQRRKATVVDGEWQERFAASEGKCEALQNEIELVKVSKLTSETLIQRDGTKQSSENFEVMLQHKEQELQTLLQIVEQSQLSETSLQGECGTFNHCVQIQFGMFI
jgi:hypothetical protein